MTPLVLCTLIIIVTLTVSGIAKVKEPTSTVTAIVNLKLDHWLPIKPIAKILPWAEIALALALFFLPGFLQILAAIAAVVIFTGYWAAIARAVIQGNTDSCNCFGSASTAPISMFTLIRNTALLMAAFGALIGAFSARGSALTMLLATDAPGWLWLIGAGLASLTLWSIYRAELVGAETNSETDELAGSQVLTAPAAGGTEEELEDYQRLPIPFAALHYPATDGGEELGERVNLRSLAAEQARILLWVSSGCSHCHKVIAKLENWQDQLPILGVHPVVSSQNQIKNFSVSDKVQFFVDPGYETQQLFGSGTPSALALGADGLLAGGPVFGSNHVTAFVEDIIAEINGDADGHEGEAVAPVEEEK